jgi:hypothetical protein
MKWIKWQIAQWVFRDYGLVINDPNGHATITGIFDKEVLVLDGHLHLPDGGIFEKPEALLSLNKTL